jgi:hypothetical protein
VPAVTAWTAGTFALTAGAATVSQSKVTANSTILITLKTASGTIAAMPWVATITPTTGFTVATGATSDTSTYNYVVIN